MKKVYRLIIVVCLFIILGGCGTSQSQEGEKYTSYLCDVKNLTLSTKILISKEGEYFGKVTGDILKFLTDPLTMYDAKGNKIAYAGDSYHFINQDSHGIYVNNEFTYDMNGLFDLFGEEYEIYNEDEKKVAYISFNIHNTKGIMYNADKKIIAEYESAYMFKDFNIKIYDDCEIDEISVIMIFCSYYSDYAADH